MTAQLLWQVQNIATILMSGIQQSVDYALDVWSYVSLAVNYLDSQW